MIKVGINGYGRIGRNVHRLLVNHPNVRVVAINSRADTKMRAHLLQRDSLHGKFEHEVSFDGDVISVAGEKVQNFFVKDAENIPWGDADVDIVLESTGSKKTKEEAGKHLHSGVKNVLVSAPMKDDTPTFVFGVNEEGISLDNKVMSNASCTTNCIAPAFKIILETFGIKNAYVTSMHSFTHSQNLLDNSGRDLRRSRSAVQSIIPTTTGAIKATGDILPELKGKIDGLAVRVPIATSFWKGPLPAWRRNTRSIFATGPGTSGSKRCSGTWLPRQFGGPISFRSTTARGPQPPPRPWSARSCSRISISSTRRTRARPGRSSRS